MEPCKPAVREGPAPGQLYEPMVRHAPIPPVTPTQPQDTVPNVSSRSGDVLNIATGTPVNSSISAR